MTISTSKLASNLHLCVCPLIIDKPLVHLASDVIKGVKGTWFAA